MFCSQSCWVKKSVETFCKGLRSPASDTQSSSFPKLCSAVAKAGSFFHQIGVEFGKGLKVESFDGGRGRVAPIGRAVAAAAAGQLAQARKSVSQSASRLVGRRSSVRPSQSLLPVRTITIREPKIGSPAANCRCVSALFSLEEHNCTRIPC